MKESLKKVHTDEQFADIFNERFFHKDKRDVLMILFGTVSESFHRSPCSVPFGFACSADGEEKPSVY